MATTTKTKARTVKPATAAKPATKRAREMLFGKAKAAKPAPTAAKPARRGRDIPESLRTLDGGSILDPAKPAKAAPATGGRKKAAAPAPASAKPAEGVRERIWKLMQRKTGTTEREVCAELGWKKAGATISRAIKAAPFKVAKTKDESTGRTRYVAGAK